MAITRSRSTLNGHGSRLLGCAAQTDTELPGITHNVLHPGLWRRLAIWPHPHHQGKRTLAEPRRWLILGDISPRPTPPKAGHPRRGPKLLAPQGGQPQRPVPSVGGPEGPCGTLEADRNEEA